jgi:excisionase family DNA binding protein
VIVATGYADDDPVSLGGAARLLGVSQTTVRHWIDWGFVPTHTVREQGRTRIQRDDLRRLTKREDGPSQPREKGGL